MLNPPTQFSKISLKTRIIKWLCVYLDIGTYELESNALICDVGRPETKKGLKND